jgi:small conductance mechanosensitive channel
MSTANLTGEIGTFISQLIAWAAIAVPNLVGALLLLIVGWWIAGRTARAITRLLARQTRIDATLRGITASLARYAILVFVVIAVLGQLGVQTTSVLAALGAAGLAIGLALQGTLSNIAAGIMLLWLRPFNVGDYIETGAAAGTVRDVGLFACQLESWDGIFQFVPNAQLWNTRIINYSRLPTRLVDLQFGVDYGDDIDKGRQVLMQLATSDARVQAEPAPIVFVNELGDSAVVLSLRAWTSTAEYWNVRRDFTAQGKRAIEDAGLSIPFPQRDVHIKDAPPSPLKQVA